MLIRSATQADLACINHIIDAAIMTWNLPERVKRLALPSYHYNETDLAHLQIVIATDAQQHCVGVAAWEPAANRDVPGQKSALLLHGIYVAPAYHQRGIGRQLFEHVEVVARQNDYDGILVKAQHNANGFFSRLGLHRLVIENAERDYANRYWKDIRNTSTTHQQAQAC